MRLEQRRKNDDARVTITPKKMRLPDLFLTQVARPIAPMGGMFLLVTLVARPTVRNIAEEHVTTTTVQSRGMGSDWHLTIMLPQMKKEI